MQLPNNCSHYLHLQIILTLLQMQNNIVFLRDRKLLYVEMQKNGGSLHIVVFYGICVNHFSIVKTEFVG